MRLALTVVGLPGQDRVEVMLTVEPATTVGAIAASLADLARGDAVKETGVGATSASGERPVVVPMRSRASAAPPPSAPSEPDQLWANGHAIDGSRTAVSALRDGMVVALDRAYAAATTLAEPFGAVELRVIGGSLAGVVHRLGIGTVSLGGHPDAGVRLAGLPHIAAELTVSPTGVRVAPVTGVTARLGNAVLAGESIWSPGEPLRIADLVFTVAAPGAPDTALTPLADGGLAYNRPPRLLPPAGQHRIDVPLQPSKRDRPKIPLLAALAPAVMGGVMAVVMHNLMFLAMCFLSPVMVFGNYISERRSNRKTSKDETMSYADKKRLFDATLAAAAAADAQERRALAPDAAELLLTATGPRRRLWERRYDDPDALALRLGTADLPADIELDLPSGARADTETPPVPVLPSVPVAVPLRRIGVLGIAGPRAADRALARWLVAQAAVLHSPRDLGIVVLAPDAEAGGVWEWLRWLPHCQPDATSDVCASVGSDPTTAARRVTELATEVTTRRRAAQANALDVGTEVHRTLIVVLDGAREIRRLPGMPLVLAEGPAVGVFAICLDDDVRLLPEECRAVVSWSLDLPNHVDLSGPDLRVGAVLADQVSVAWADRVARALAPLRDVSREDAEGGVPDSARLLDVLALADPTPRAIIDGWRAGGRTTTATIGLSAEGPFSLDLRFDGPHGLIAGTTGAGKSELLQTIIASLAVANRPDEMTFVLIDYKGGSAFKDCARLPHTVGMVSDLDPHLTQRALASLSAELKRREELLLEADAKDIEDYCDAADAGADLDPLPRLTLVIDEFASLAKELPEFVTGLVGIAQRGRSLGVHLLLATQRPAGVVSADIRANTNLRIALRVTDKTESQDVIDAGDAARISRSTPGRCYVRSGSSSLIAVQAARVGGRRVTSAGPGARALWPVAVDWRALGHPLPTPPVVDDDDTMETDLTVLVDAVRLAADELGVATQRSPWLPPLPDTLTLDEIADTAELTFGLQDVPERQSRTPLSMDLEGSGHLLIAGSPRSGRTATLRTIAGSIVASCSPDDVHVYAVDCGGNGLLPLVAMPHCGAVVTRDQTDRLDRLIGRLTAEVSRRQQLLATNMQASISEQRRAADPADRLPWMVLMLDRWEGYVAAFESYDAGRLIDSMLGLLREGPAVGLRAIVTSDRTGLYGQLSTVIDERILLRLSDPADYGIAGVAQRDVPVSMPPGRALVPSGAGPHEAQIALLAADPSGVAQVAALQTLISKAAAAQSGVPVPGLRPLRVDALPVLVTEAEVDAMTPAIVPAGLWVRVGIGGDEITAVGVDLIADGPGFMVAGPPRSGRSTALVAMVRWLLQREIPVVLVTPRRSPLRALAVMPGVLGVLGAEDTPEQLTSLTEGLLRYVLVVDDAELLVDTPLSTALDEAIRTARDGEHGVLAAGTADTLATTYRGFTVDVRRSRSGLILAPKTPADGDILGVRLPRGVEGGPAGRAILVLGGATWPVQIPNVGG